MVRFECTCFIDMRYVHLKNIDFEFGCAAKTNQFVVRNNEDLCLECEKQVVDLTTKSPEEINSLFENMTVSFVVSFMIIN
ncbi:MAG: hypothetical protein JKY42_11150 [Flavobacteriales bacterium]|nr:hypothetical protein [Flavobacteriales bacterium]